MKLNTWCFCFSLLMQTLYLTHSYAQHWQPLSMNGGGFITQVIPHPTDENTWVGTVDIGQAYITHNNGLSWQPLCPQIPKIEEDFFGTRSFLFDSIDPSNMYFLTGRGSGSNKSFLFQYDETNNDLSYESLPINIDANDEGRWGGTTLLQKTNGANTTIWIAGQTQINNAGTSIGNGGLAYKINSNMVTKAPTTFFDHMNIVKIAFSYTEPDKIIVAAINKSRNNAGNNNLAMGLYSYNTATNVAAILNNNIPVYDFDFDAIQRNILAITTDSSLYKYDLSTNILTAIAAPAIDNVTIDRYACFATCHPTITGRWFFGTYRFNQGIIVYTNDSGNTYKRVRYKSGTVNATNFLDYTQAPSTDHKHKFGNQMAGIVFSKTNPNKAMISDFASIWSTNNANLTFFDSLATNFDNNATWTWKMADQGLMALALLRFSKKPNSETSFYANMADESYYNTFNFGGNMNYNQAYADGSPFINMTTKTVWDEANNKVYMVGCKGHGLGGRMVQSSDQGLTWSEPQPITTPGDNLYNQSDVVTDLVLCNNILYAGISLKNGFNYQMIVKSSDGGQTWTSWGTGLPSTPSNGLPFRLWEKMDHLLKDANNNTLYVFFNQELWKRGVNENIWTKISLPIANNIKMAKTSENNSGQLLISFANGNLYKLTDANTTPIWQLINKPGTGNADILAQSQDNKVVMVTSPIPATNTPQKIWLSYNAIQNPSTASWEEISQENIWGMLANIDFLNNNELLAFTKGTGAFRKTIDCNTAFHWNGGTNTEWHSPSNWNCGNLPDTNSKIIIHDGLVHYPEINASVEIWSLELKPQATLKIINNAILKIIGN